MLTSKKKEIYEWFKTASKILSRKHLIKAAKEKRKEYHDFMSLKYFDLMVFYHTSKIHHTEDPLKRFRDKPSYSVSKKKKKYALKPGESDKFQWVHFIPTPMGGANKRK